VEIVFPSSDSVSIDATSNATASVARRRLDWVAFARPTIGLVLVVLAYRVSLITLVESMRLDTPLAHLALVPFISLGLAYVSRNHHAGPAIHDRQLDWIVGLFLSIIALACNVVLPARLSSQFWVWRVDLLTLPLFVSGVICLLFGVRTLWKYRSAVLFLFFAWPYPFNVVLDRWLGRFTQTTIWALDVALHRVALATRVAGNSSNFLVTRNGHNVQLSVASACSGANGVVGFMLVAAAFLMVLKGSKVRKFTWLALGATLVWLLNVARIMVIFWAAGQWGERVAIDGFHPYVGLVVFNIAVLIMVLLLKPFGLRIRVNDPELPNGTPANRPKLPTAMAAVTVMALGLGVYNGQLNDYDRIANSLGTPRLTDFATSQETPADWKLNFVSKQLGYERFFGDDSTWNRYQYTYQGPAVDASLPSTAATPLTGNVAITLDVVDTPDRAALDAYGIEQCYTFHGYSITGRQTVDLGDGLIGGMLTWTSPETTLTWTTLYWHWPIKTATGTRYERVTMIMIDQPTNKFTSPPLATGGARQLQLDLNDVLRGVSNPEAKARLLQTRQFMISFAHQLVVLRAPAGATASVPTSTTVGVPATVSTVPASTPTPADSTIPESRD
jgi:exosortase/archaeosortase family protein